ncbi:MAG: hypothetical protein U1G07_23520 [Verrucomicrobiota bacterium]
MSLVDPQKKYWFYRGGNLVGIVGVVGSDQPFFCGRIEPAEGYGEIAPLLERLAVNRRQRRSPDIVGVSADKRAARDRLAYEHAQIVQEFAQPGLRMVDMATGELVFEPLDLEVDERGFWWTGHIWQDGKRIT